MRNVRDFGRVFLRSNYTDITQNHLYPRLNGYVNNGQRNVWASGVSTYCTPSMMSYLSKCACPTTRHSNVVTLACVLQSATSFGIVLGMQSLLGIYPASEV